MQLTDLQLAVRPRRPWEAVDLGVRLVQSEARLLWTVWLTVSLPVFLFTLGALLVTGNPWWSLLAWWLKPLYDYALLIVLSRRVFGETPSLRLVLTELAASWRHGLLHYLTWMRFSMSRAYLIPVWLLERLPATERQSRIRLLRQVYTARARWLFLIMVHLEFMLSTTALGLVFWLAPTGQTGMLWELMLESHGNQLVEGGKLLAWFVAMSLIEPFYVAAGFCLYLNRRTELEAWDLELSFRQIRERLFAAGRSAP